MRKKDKTAIGVTGKPVSNSSDVSPYCNPKKKTFKEFIEIVEGKKNNNEPHNAVPGTYKVDIETGARSYTLKPADPDDTGSFTKKQVFKNLQQQGGIGRKSVLKGIEQRKKELKKLRKKSKVIESKVILGKDETYGSKGYQKRLEKQRKQSAQEKETQRQQNADAARREFRTKGVPFSDAKGKGHIVNGKKQYST